MYSNNIIGSYFPINITNAKIKKNSIIHIDQFCSFII